MDRVEVVRRLNAHRLWANARLRAAAQGLAPSQLDTPIEMGWGSLMATLVHLYAAEYIWIEALSGNPEPPGPRDVTFESWETLCVAWDALERRWSRHTDALKPGQLDALVTKASTSGPTAGQVASVPAQDVLLHVHTHAQYTSAQAINMLRRLGAKQLPNVQLIGMSRAGELSGVTPGKGGLRLIHTLFEHLRWATEELTDAARACSKDQLRQTFPVGMGSVWGTLVHLYDAEHEWVGVLEGGEAQAMLDAEAIASWGELDQRWTAVAERWGSLLAGLEDADLARPVRKAVTLPGQAEPGPVYETPLCDVLLQVCLHAQYTTAQAANMLRHAGGPVPETQLITLSRQRAARG